MSYKVEMLPNSYGELGEGPHWDIETQSLYFVDIHGPTLLRYDLKENKTYQAKIENEKFAAFIIPIENKPNHFAVGLTRRVCDIEWDGKSKYCKIGCTLFEIEQNDKYKNNRINDGKADPMGRLYTGTMYYPELHSKIPKSGNFYCLESGKTPILIKDEIGISNGLAWDLNNSKMYYNDSFDFEVKEYEYDVNTGKVKLSKIAYKYDVKDKDNPDRFPDGMTIDSDGNLYVATWGISKVLKINPKTSKVELEIDLPCEQITSAAFGGPNMDILYVTSSSLGGKTNPAGHTFKVTGLGSKGLEMYKFKI